MGSTANVRWVRAESNPVEDPAGALVRTLSRIPSLFGQLVSYASHLAAHANRERESDQALQAARKVVFWRWLNLDLEQQKTDLQAYAVWVGSDMASVLEQRLRLGPQLLAPRDASEGERQLLLSDLQALLELERSRHKVVLPVSAPILTPQEGS